MSNTLGNNIPNILGNFKENWEWKFNLNCMIFWTLWTKIKQIINHLLDAFCKSVRKKFDQLLHISKKIRKDIRSVFFRPEIIWQQENSTKKLTKNKHSTK